MAVPPDYVQRHQNSWRRMGRRRRKNRKKNATQEPPHQQNLTEEKKRKQKFFSSIFFVSVFYCFPPFSFLLVFRLFLVRPTFI
jgi:hypothetical protein